VRRLVGHVHRNRGPQRRDPPGKASKDTEIRASVRGVRPTGPATRQRIRTILRKAVNDALAEELIVGSNPATLVKTPGDRVLPIVWEAERGRTVEDHR
jgi:hypothetical protein